MGEEATSLFPQEFRQACMGGQGSPEGVGVGLLGHLGAVWAVVGHARQRGQAGVHLQAQASLPRWLYGPGRPQM